MSEKVTLADALSNVDVLDELPLPDEQVKKQLFYRVSRKIEMSPWREI